uniref:Uncharacterized protein n=1 Tax=Callorhinchus milii TaxID=7868 RepID=A0A4W3H2Y8_CALMI
MAVRLAAFPGKLRAALRSPSCRSVIFYPSPGAGLVIRAVTEIRDQQVIHRMLYWASNGEQHHRAVLNLALRHHYHTSLSLTPQQ